MTTNTRTFNRARIATNVNTMHAMHDAHVLKSMQHARVAIAKRHVDTRINDALHAIVYVAIAITLFAIFV